MLVYRLRVPRVSSRGSGCKRLSGGALLRCRRRRRRVGTSCGGRRRSPLTGRFLKGRRRRSMRGGFLPAVLAPIIAAAVGAVPAIASVALQAKAMNQQR